MAKNVLGVRWRISFWRAWDRESVSILIGMSVSCTACGVGRFRLPALLVAAMEDGKISSRSVREVAEDPANPSQLFCRVCSSSVFVECETFRTLVRIGAQKAFQVLMESAPRSQLKWN